MITIISITANTTTSPIITYNSVFPEEGEGLGEGDGEGSGEGSGDGEDFFGVIVTEPDSRDSSGFASTVTEALTLALVS